MGGNGMGPGLPRRTRDVASMLRFGGTLTLNGLVVYAAYNIEKVLLGRYFGAHVLGSYGRAYQLVQMPTQALNARAWRRRICCARARCSRSPLALGAIF